MRPLLLLAFVLLGPFVHGSVFAADVALFYPARVPVFGYDDKLQTLAPDDVLVFSNGARYRVEGPAWQGKKSKIVAIGPTLVLRLPLRDGKFGELTYGQHLDEYLEAYKRLREAGVPVPRIFLELSLPGEYLVTERIDVRFTLEELLEGRAAVSLSEKPGIYAKLVEFARSTWRFARVGDLAPYNIAWDGSRWIALDFGNSFKRFVFAPDEHVLQGIGLPDHVARRIDKAVREERVKADPSLCARYLMKGRVKGE
jgi:hypothetical protein